MTRPRWHDVLIVVAIVVIASAGAWALWWDDVRGTKPDDKGAPPPITQPQT